MTYQINSEKDAVVPSLAAYMPYPQSEMPLLNMPFHVLSSLVLNRKKLDPLLSAMLDKEDFFAQCSATYYWLSNSWIYS